MNIIIITILLPYPLTSGGAQGIYNMIDNLRNKHHITIIFPSGNGNSLKAMKQLQALWPEVDFRPYSYFQQLTYLPFFRDKAMRAIKLAFQSNSERFMAERIIKPYGYNLTKQFIRFINRVIREKHADIVQTEFYPYLHLIDYLPSDVKKIFIHHEIRFVRNERFTKRLHLTPKEKALMERLKKQEIADLNKYDRVVTVTDIDKDILQKESVHSQICVSPSAINTPQMPYQGWNGKLVFVGGFAHTPNQEGIKWFLQEAAPLIDWTTEKVTEFVIIGKGWTEKYIDSINSSNLKVRLAGFVEHLADEAYGAIMLVPILSGSGMRMKILEASALCTPIITTTVGVEGIELQNGVSCMTADTPDAFVKAIQQVTHHEELRQSLTANASIVFEHKYSVSALVSRREQIYQSL
jgi:glycosyltransferase involved in cell wall biosynthesis